MSENVNLLVTLRPYQDKVDELRSVLEKLTDLSQGEDGCLEYRLGEAIEQNIFYIKECWVNEKALKQHEQSTHFVEAGPMVSSCCESVELQRIVWEE